MVHKNILQQLLWLIFHLIVGENEQVHYRL
jgi:hypothetical protein